MAKFKIATEHTFWWPVTVSLPDPEKSGKLVKQTLEMHFKSLPLDEFTARQEEAQRNPAKNPALEDADFLAEITLGWRGVENDDGSEAEFTTDALKQAAQFPWFRNGALAAYRKAITGDLARQGN